MDGVMRVTHIHTVCMHTVAGEPLAQSLIFCEAITARSCIKMKCQGMFESITVRTKRDHWVPGLPRHRWYTVHQQGNGYEMLLLGCRLVSSFGKRLERPKIVT